MSREGAQQMMLGHHGKFPTLPAPKRPAGPTRQTFRTDTEAIQRAKARRSPSWSEIGVTPSVETIVSMGNA